MPAFEPMAWPPRPRFRDKLLRVFAAALGVLIALATTLWLHVTLEGRVTAVPARDAYMHTASVHDAYDRFQGITRVAIDSLSLTRTLQLRAHYAFADPDSTAQAALGGLRLSPVAITLLADTTAAQDPAFWAHDTIAVHALVNRRQRFAYTAVVALAGDRLRFDVPYEEFVRLARGPLTEVRLGDLEIVLPPATLQALQDAASRRRPRGGDADHGGWMRRWRQVLLLTR